ncbi:MAG TPA: hypothetical protein VMD47_02795 [Candidatus Acidoferrales bacterium]|nr:hypothetical protein [Candidatus Acidoferrales bacterium]
MTVRTFAIALLAAASAAVSLPSAAATPKPAPTVKLATVAEHSEFLVEVNAKGQVVRVVARKGTGAKDPLFNEHTYGNVLQMWIRHPDGTAQVGLYKVTYDYDPKTKKIARNVSLVKAGGNWGNEPGAVTQMENDVEAAKEAREKANLPPLQSIIGPTASPTKHP